MMNTFMLLYLVVLWIKKTFYSLPKLYPNLLDQPCQNNGINVWQHLCVQTAVFVNENHREQVKNKT